ncbi:hypothetical protein SAMN05216431_101165 [Ligilactobacillus sp. WC1T17]|uniref:Uncharacterized protein n=1 Tax=Ligilactobacillus ruminis TaxID=1623 RepID=A0ABY1A978_9LACO|nr:hypothetical protein SAMN05216431_101165 [Ligilactobacillus ruminis]
MEKAKVQTLGKYTVLVLSKGFKTKTDEYYLSQAKDGTLTLVPRQQN